MAGIDRQSGAGDMLRAVYEGLAAWICVNVSRFEAISGVRPDHLLLTGGGSRNRTYSEIKAAMLGRRLLASDMSEAAGVGAALVGGIAVGLFSDAGEAAANPAHDVVSVEPDPELVAAYDGLRASLIEYVTPFAAP
jgi:sugar (pentulose or hexulose) kinase